MRITRRKLDIAVTADELVARLLAVSETASLCLLDSCGVSHLGSRYLIAGVGPCDIKEFNGDDPSATLAALDRELSRPGKFSFLTISYDFGLKLEQIVAKQVTTAAAEPDVFIAQFEAVVIHDYETGATMLAGQMLAVETLSRLLAATVSPDEADDAWPTVRVCSNFKRKEYLERIEMIRELIRCGETYQTNLTQRLTAHLPPDATPERVFSRLRKNNPAPFASFFRRPDSIVISASPERFFRIAGDRISTSPIKGTRPRGLDPETDAALQKELVESQKDRAENVMIVDLLRNDLGRVCEFGSVEVEKLCELEVHPSLFHLVSTVAGRLRPEICFSDVIRAVFPCGSITGAPKINTMKIIERLETENRGLSMGAIGFARGCWEGDRGLLDLLPAVDLAVAIRTMTIRGSEAVFHVGGGIVIDSDPSDEFEETLTKAGALLDAIRGKLK